MKAALLITNAVAAIMTIVGVIFLVRGIVTLIRGKCKLCGKLLKEKSARTVGIVFIIAPVLAFALWAIQYETQGWGRIGTNNWENAVRNVTSASVQSGLFIVGIGLAYLWAYFKAKAEMRTQIEE
jgi:predicted permease